MKKQIFFALIILLSLVACKGRSPYDYNEYIINKEQELAASDDKTDTKINNFITANSEDSIALAGVEMEKIAETHLAEIKKEPRFLFRLSNIVADGKKIDKDLMKYDLY